MKYKRHSGLAFISFGVGLLCLLYTTCSYASGLKFERRLSLDAAVFNGDNTNRSARFGRVSFDSDTIFIDSSGTNMTFTDGSNTAVTLSSLASPLTTKGDLFSYTTTGARLAVGTDGQILSADSATASGLRWVNRNTALPVTTAGDILIHDGTIPTRFVVGTNGQVLSADSGATGGLRWVARNTILPVTSKGSIITYTTVPIEFAVGANGTVLSADSSTVTGLAWVSPPAGGGTPGGNNANVQFNNASSFGGDLSMNWNASTNMLGISRDASQSGYALVISGDLATQGALANVSHDGTAHFQALQLNNALSADQGGTSFATYVKGDLIVPSAATTLNRLAVGSNGQLLSADSSTTTGLVWVARNTILPVTTKGDVMIHDGTIPTRFPVGANGTVLSADSSTATGLAWIAPPAGGGGGTPGGSTTQIQFNSAGSFGGAALFTWDSTNSRVSIGPGAGLVSFDVAGSSRNVPFALTDGATIALDASRSNFFTVTLAGQPRTLSNATNAVAGQKIILMVSQDSTGSRKIGFGTNYKFGTDVSTYDASTTASTKDFIGMIFDGVSFDIVSVSKGYR